MSALMRPLPWWRRWMAAIGRALERRAFSPLPNEHEAGADFAMGQPAYPELSAEAALSAWAVFPWIWAAGTVISSDLSRLPLRLYRGEGRDAQRIESHPMIDILRRPSERIRGGQFRAQMAIDRVIVGNAYMLELGNGMQPSSLLRLHPSRTRPVPAADGQVEEYLHDGAGRQHRYAWDQVEHIRGPSWEDGPEGLYGTGMIRSLVDHLNADRAAWKRQANAHQMGRPEALVSPDTTDPAGMRWSPKQVTEIRSAIDAIFAKATGGVAVLPAGMQLETLSWSPANLESARLHDDVRQAIVAVSGVPPIRLGLETANYATAREQSFTYWDDTIRGYAREFDDAYTEIARRFDPQLRVEHDFSEVAALRHARGELIDQATKLWAMGIDLQEALVTSGLDDVKVPTMAEPRPAPASEPPPDEGDMDEDADTRALVDALWGEPRLAVVAKTWERPHTEEARVEAWRSFADDLHRPGERAFSVDFQRYQKAAAKRYAERLESVMATRAATGEVVKQLDPASLEQILATLDEDEALAEAVGPEMRRRVRLAFERAARQVGADIEYAPDEEWVETRLARLSPMVNDTTRAAIEDIVTVGTTDGWSIREMQDAILQHSAFSPRRALRVARTETTRQVNAGALQAYEAAREAGVDVRKEWLSSRDSAVRDEHADLDGQTVGVGESFESGGYAAGYPGDFGAPEMDINCRCTVIPALTGGSQ